MRPRAKQLRSVAGTDGQVLTVQDDDVSVAAEAATNPGATTGTKSQSILFTSDITAITAPSSGTLGVGTDTLDFPDGAVTGQRFDFNVPDDYDSGDLILKTTYRMSTAVANPNNQVRIETAAEIAKASDGTVDTASYPATEANHTVPDNLIDIVRETFMTISSVDFAAGDALVFFFKRDGIDANDLHTGSLRVISFSVQYTASIQNSADITTVLIFSDTDETPPTTGTLSSFDTLDFTTGIDTEQKFAFGVPDNWDEASDIYITFIYAMSSAESSKFLRIATEGEVADTVNGTLNTQSVVTIDVPAPTTTDVSNIGVVRTVLSSSVNKGDFVTLFLARRGSATEDTHGGDIQLIGASVHIGVAPQSGFALIEEKYLEHLDFNPVSSSSDVSGNLESPNFAGDFETYALLTSTISTGRIDVSFQGRLGETQATVSSIAIPLNGSAGSQYSLKVYVEGQGATPVYDSTLTSAPTSRTVITVIALDLLNQPTGEKKFFVVVEATLDAGETLRVGKPFVKQT